MSFCENSAMFDFDSFFYKFNNDALFQKQHVLFPLLCILPETDTSEIRKVCIAEDEWESISFPAEQVIISHDFINSKMIICTVTYSDMDTRYVLVFRELDSQWLLTDYIDQSY